jgi:leucyl aminopeptidase
MNLPELSLVPTPGSADVLVLGLAEAAGAPVVVGASDALEAEFASRFGATIAALAAQVGATPKPGSTAVLPSPSGPVVVTGLGEADVTPDRVRRAAANGIRRALEASGERSVSVTISLDAYEPEVLAAAAEGALLGAYRFDKLGTPNAAASASRIDLVGPADATDAVAAARITAEAVWLARDWVNTPANVLYPESFAEAARASLKGLAVGIEVLDEKALAKGGFGGILAVGGGSARPPRLVTVTWAPKGAQSHLVLVGKGLTFDTGGLNLKTAEGMITMKMDMGGAAAVLAAVRAVAQLGLRVKVTALAGMAENMPSGTAFRPSDVLTMHSGKTVENFNSDAEGRLVLADALSVAGGLSPDLIVDVATLTGASIVALGDRTAGLMASDDGVAETVLDAAEAAGEAVWHLPIPEEIAENLKSDVADLKSGGPRPAGASTAAAFLREFVPPATPWAHLDIAGPAWAEKAYDHVSKGGTGAGVRTLVALARSLAR